MLCYLFQQGHILETKKRPRFTAFNEKLNSFGGFVEFQFLQINLDIQHVNLIYITHSTWHHKRSLLHWEEVLLAIIRPTSHFNICHASHLQWCSGTSRPLTPHCGCGGLLRPISCWHPQSWFWDTVASVLHGGQCWSPPPDDKMITKFGFMTSTSNRWWLIESCCS